MGILWRTLVWPCRKFRRLAGWRWSWAQERSWPGEKTKPVVYPLQTKTWSECYHVNGGDPAEETPPSRRATVNKRGHVDDVQNHQQRRDNGTGIANNRSVSAQCCQSSEMNEKRNKEFTFGVFVYLPDVVGRWGSRRWCWTEESHYSPSWPGTALHMRPLTQKRCHQMIQKEGRSDSTSMTLDVFYAGEDFSILIGWFHLSSRTLAKHLNCENDGSSVFRPFRRAEQYNKRGHLTFQFRRPRYLKAGK